MYELQVYVDGFGKKYESDELITSIARELCVQDCKFYTCHCTGTKAYQIMKKEMNDKLGYLSSGMVLEYGYKVGKISMKEQTVEFVKE